MVKLTENKVAEIDTSALEKRARDIRDAVVTKSVTVEMVGSLFADLITACGNVRDSLALFLDTNVQEITNDIDNRRVWTLRPRQRQPKHKRARPHVRWLTTSWGC